MAKGKKEGSHNKLNICLFSFRSVNNKEYKESLLKLNARVFEIENDEHCQAILESVECNGILIDIPTYIKSSSLAKEFMSNMEMIYPTAKIRYNKESKNIDLMILGEKNQISLQDFLKKRCRGFNARKLRMHKRLPINLNMRLFLEQDGKSSESLCTSANVSQNGIFIVDKEYSLPIGTKVKIQILELKKNSFLHGTVTRISNWGEMLFHAPGFGIRIDKVDKEILEDYAVLIKTRNL